MAVEKKKESAATSRASYKKITSRTSLFSRYFNEASFTLVEILIVIGVIAILTAVTLVILNPVEYIKRGRDDQRMGDINSLQTLITQKEYSGNRISFGQSNVVYISLADSSSTCGSYTLPGLAAGWSYHCAPTASYRNVDGTGWLPVDLSASKTFAVLPLDPTNDQNYYYAFIASSDNSFVLTSMFESQQELKNIAAKDNGTDDTRYETGTNLALWTQASGLVGYWKFDEGSGTTTADASGNGNTGTLYNSPIWQTGSNCKEGSCLSFNGTNSFVRILNSSTINPGTSNFSTNVWYNTNSLSGILYNKESLYETETASECGQAGCYAWQPAWAWRGSGFNAVTGQWIMMTMVYDHANQYLYKNGVLVYSTPLTGDMGTNGNNLTFAARSDGTSAFFNGALDEIRFYNRALSAAEVQNLYTAEK